MQNNLKNFLIFPFIVIAQACTFASLFNTEVNFSNLDDSISVVCSMQPRFKTELAVFQKKEKVNEFVKVARDMNNNWRKQITIAGLPPLCGFNAINIDYYNAEVKKFHHELIHDPESHINRITFYQRNNQIFRSCKYEGDSTFFKDIDVSDYNHIKTLCGI